MVEIVHKDHELLNTKLDTFDFNNPPIDPKELAKTLLDNMNAKNGMGLAANQLGLPYRAFIMRTNPALVCFNPKIVDESNSYVTMEEGCLTYPLLYVKIRRPDGIRVRFQNELGEMQTEKFNGITARVFQHELDHLNGINYLNRASNYHLQKAKNKVKLLNRKKRKLGDIL